MSYYNHYKGSRRIRGRSCPAGVRFEINDIKDVDSVHQRSDFSTNPSATLTKEMNTCRKRRSSLPSMIYLGVNLGDLSPRHLVNYSFLAGGAHNLFCCKLDGTVCNNHLSIDRSHQHKGPNKFNIEKRFSSNGSSPRHLISRHVRKETIELETPILLDSCGSVFEQKSTVLGTAFQFSENAVIVKDINRSSLSWATSKDRNPQKSCLALGSRGSEGKNGEFHFKIENFGEVIESSKVSDLDDKVLQWLLSKQVVDPGEFLNDVESLECRVHDTKRLADSLASQVEEEKGDSKMNQKKQESELSDLLSLNEEMQTIWSEKESEVREILERFSMYRDAVDADSKEKDEMYAEELNKREMIIRELELSKNNLEEKLSRKEAIMEQVIKDLQQNEATRLQELLEIDKLVTSLAGKYTESETGGEAARQYISERLQSVIAGFEDKGFTNNSSSLDVPGQRGLPDCGVPNVDNIGVDNLDVSHASNANEDVPTAQFSNGGEKNPNRKTIFRDNEPRTAEEQFALSKHTGQLASPTEKISSHVGIVAGHARPYGVNEDQFQDECPHFYGQIDNLREEHRSTKERLFHEIPTEETLEEGLVKFVERMEEKGIEGERNASDDEDGLMEAYVERKALVKLLEEQLTSYQLLCKEKDDEVQHWKRKHKQDTKDLQDILEEQERAETKNREALAELQLEIDKLRRKNKTLECEVEMAKEQGEDEVCVLRASFQKDLTDQLRRQSKSFLSVEEASRLQLAELERKNEELRRGNEDLRQQIADHCAEIKSWVTGILLLTEEEYQEEFHTISDVLAKLQKIIVENKQTIGKLQDQLNESENAENHPGSPTGDPLSHSWGVYSWNSVDSQKELCCNCWQTKWRRVLMGSFDLAESGLEVKQDEIEKYLTKIDINEPKYRKKQSLKDSLELADVQSQLIQRRGEQNWKSLGTLGEGSVEEEGSVSGSSLEGFESVFCFEYKEKECRIPLSDAEAHATLEDNKKEIRLQACGVAKEMVGQESVLLTTEEVKELGNGDLDFDEKQSGIDRPERDGGKDGKREMKRLDGERDEKNEEKQKEDENEGARHERPVLLKKKVDKLLVEHEVKTEENSEKEQSQNDRNKGSSQEGEGNGDMKEGNSIVEEGESQEQQGDRSEQVGDSKEQEGERKKKEGDSKKQEDDRTDQENDRKEQEGDTKKQEDDSNEQEDYRTDQEDERKEQVGVRKEQEDDRKEQVGESEEQEDDSDEQLSDSGDEVGYSEDHEGDHGNEKGDSEKQVVDNDEEDDDDEDLVHVVNLYRSLVIDNCSPRLNLNDKSTCNRSDWNNEKDLIFLNESVVDNGGSEEHSVINDFGNQQTEEQHATRMEGVSWNPIVVFQKDYNGNLPLTHTNSFVGTDSNAETRQDGKPFDFFNPKGLIEENDSNKHDTRPGKLGLDEPKLHEISESLKLDVVYGKSLNDFQEKVQNNKIPSDSCPHCARVLKENPAGYEKCIEKLLELKSQQAKDYESQIFRELDETKADVKRFQQQYEDLEKVCEDYRKSIDEYSEKVRHKNSELRKLKLSSSVMKTEVEWLRQALGITRDYCDLSKDF